MQETRLRLSRTKVEDITNPGGWLTTTTARICLDMLRSRKARREESFDKIGSKTIHEAGKGLEDRLTAADSVGRPCLWCSKNLLPLNVWHSSCCATYLRYRTMRSPPLSAGPQRLRANSQAAPAAACKVCRRRIAPTAPCGGSSSKPFLPRREAATSRRWYPCWIRTPFFPGRLRSYPPGFAS